MNTIPRDSMALQHALINISVFTNNDENKSTYHITIMMEERQVNHYGIEQGITKAEKRRNLPSVDSIKTYMLHTKHFPRRKRNGKKDQYG